MCQTPFKEKQKGLGHVAEPFLFLVRLCHPHSLNPHTWHFTHPSAYSSCEPQSGHVPMNVSPPLYASYDISVCPPACPVVRTTTGSGADEVATGETPSSCCTPCLSLHHCSSAIPIASGTEST